MTPKTTTDGPRNLPDCAPCPFCGDDEHLQVVEVSTPDIDQGYVIRCGQCLAEGPISSDSMIGACVEWNDRAPVQMDGKVLMDPAKVNALQEELRAFRVAREVEMEAARNPKWWSEHRGFCAHCGHATMAGTLCVLCKREGHTPVSNPDIDRCKAEGCYLDGGRS